MYNSNKKIVKRINIETVQAKISLDLSPCPECGGILNFYLDCPFSDGNIIIPAICAERCSVQCEALIYCEECDYEEFLELFPQTKKVSETEVEEKDIFKQ